MSIFNQIQAGKHSAIHTRESRTVPYGFPEVGEMLLDTRQILPSSFTDASVEYPGERLAEGNTLEVHLSAIVRKDFSAYVTEVYETSDGLRVKIEVDEKNFAIAALTIAVNPHPKNRAQTLAEGKLSVVEHHLPAPGLIIRAAAGRAIGSFIDRTVKNVEAVIYDKRTL